MKCRDKIAVLLFFASALMASAQSNPQGHPQATQTRGFWIDPSTGLMWMARDNGRDVSWKKAMKYCRDLRLAGYSDWRLPNMAELQGTYDEAVNSQGLAGVHDDEQTTRHVKGDLFLTGYQWSSNYRMDDRGRPVGYAYYFDFNQGKPNDDADGYSSFKRALCVRGPGR